MTSTNVYALINTTILVVVKEMKDNLETQLLI